MGSLLKKAALLTSSEELPDFFYYCKNNSISHYLLLDLYNDYFFVKKSFGLDYESIAKSYSTKDFWNGIICKNDFLYKYEVTNYDSNPFLQFFSQKTQNQIKKIYIKRNDNSILINCQNNLFNSKFLDKKEYFFQIDSSENLILNKYVIDLSYLLNELLIKNIPVNEKNQKTVFFEEILYRTVDALKDLPVIIKRDIDKLYLYFKKLDFSEEIILNHLLLSYHDFYSDTSIIKIYNIGKVLLYQELNS